MEMKVHIPFQELLTIVRQLSPTQKAKIQKELSQITVSRAKKSKLKQLLLNGPVFTNSQIKIIQETRNSINQWRTKF